MTEHYNETKLLALLENILDRKIKIDSLGALATAINHKSAPESINLNKTAIGIDANVFLRLSKHKNIEDIIDYFNTSHTAPLILPGQSIQEFWNNQLYVVDTVSASLKKKFDTLKSETEKISEDFNSFYREFEKTFDSFENDYGYIYEEKTIRSTLSLLEMLRGRANVTYIPRERFHRIAENRKRTRTPPGFKDDGHGDFYIWAEFLFGLLKEKELNKEFNHIVFLTNDQKIDWSRNGIAHPILTAEIQATFNISLEIWNLEKLWNAINKS
ncbi:PIN-like domain-containing protein [Alcaligenes sp. GCM10023179]|uniref:PIN-like domain-containing protein n=1 Tax=Alcaligenes sp. GCM10023179 TaxID=3252633 RepID=UPI00360C186F